MPVDFMSDKIYKVDYTAWKRELSQMPIFDSGEVQKIYLDKWMEILKAQDGFACRDYNNPKMKMLMLKEKMEAPENFQIPVNYETNTMFIHFRVSRIIQMIEQSGVSLDNAINIDIKEFTDKNMRINWTPTTDIVKIKTQPIIIAPLTVDKFYQWLVIDGNHRITHAIAEREKSVKAFSLDPNALVEGNLFSTGFDKFLYIFQNEMIALASYIHRDGYSDEEAIKLAYFCSGKVQCYV
nr:MAG TPA: hypothetical protein [Bacteriophage sp.]